ncbi:uncharacterized protein LOC128263705 [Drosophila gunungcola]|uniref:uncharacterized protein LOC128263705 n=1 Tax=Drosophila gunungcola TaxID=103775 RepID=UPI0022E06A68|nr:uncharacterized protein LOC128263705 [Drosophila gunungcola]
MKDYLTAGATKQFDESDVLARLEWVNSMNLEFDSAQTSLEKLDFSEISKDTRFEFSAILMDLKAKLNRALAALRKLHLPGSTAANSASFDIINNANLSFRFRNPRLPNLEIALFQGSYSEWPDFIATFTTAHVQSIFGLKGVEKGSAKGLRELSDWMNSHLRAIRTLATTQQILDGFLIHIVTHKLDQRTREKWEDDLSISELSTWDAMESFLEKRCRLMENLDLAVASVEMHGFCDASTAAYGVCLYLRSEANGNAEAHLLCAKSRVAPLKVLTIPRLELSASCLLAELFVNVKETIGFDCSSHCWSDSSIVLAWIRQAPREFNVFVSNRIENIQEMTKGMAWHHVPTDLNPTDVVSRGCTPKELLEYSLWANRPPFLLKGASNWPSLLDAVKNLPERRSMALIGTVGTDISINCKFLNSFDKLQRVFAYIYRFISSCRAKSLPSTIYFTVDEISFGTVLLLKSIQQVHIAVEYEVLNQVKPCPPKSKLISLKPILSSEGLLRVFGRLQNASLDYEAKHPILLPKDHPVTRAIIVYYHEKYFHAGPQALLAALRQRYWPLGGRKFVASVINKCVRCFRMNPVAWEHMMGSLPVDRVQPNPAFHTTGVDYCGPFYHKSEARNKAPHKCYIAVFVCFSTKAAHLEVVQDLTTDSFIAALRRFINLRGSSRTIRSDNATNFVGAKRELAELKELFLSEPHTASITSSCLANGIDWKFIPPRAPHFGGLWETAVKSAKFHFYRVKTLKILRC